MNIDPPADFSRRTGLLHTALILLALLFLAPFLSLLSTSLRNDRHAAAHPSEILPRAEYTRRPNGEWREILQTSGLTPPDAPGAMNARIGNWSGTVDKTVTIRPEQMVTRLGATPRNYFHGLLADGFARYSWTTLLVCGFSVLAVTASSALVAYSFSVLRWPGRDWAFYVTLGTLMLPAPLAMAPMFLLYHGLGWAHGYAPLMVPALFGNSFFIFLLRQFFLKIPRDLIEAARLEGSSEWQVFSRVVVPAAVPALVVVAVLAFLWQWGELLTPLIYLTSTVKDTLSLALAQLQGKAPGHPGELMAMSAVLVLPVAVLVFLLRRTLFRGIRTLLPAQISR